LRTYHFIDIDIEPILFAARAQDNLMAHMEPTLIIDADAEVYRQMFKVLTDLGEKAVYKENGKSALRYLQTHVPRLIIADVTLLDMNGITLMEIIRKDPRLARVPFILFGNDLSYADEAKAQGAAEYWVKSDILFSNLRPLVARYLMRKTVAPARPSTTHRVFAKENREEKPN
jgi:CheY-like chemotaxis protein